MGRNPVGQQVDGPGTAGVVGRPILLFPAAVLVGLALDRLLPVPVPIPQVDAVRWIVAAALILIGLALFAAGVRNFSRAETPLPTNQPARVLVTTGIYRWTRNPIYLSFFLAYAGIGVATFSPWILILLLPLVVTIRYGVVAREEAYLRRLSGLQGPRAPLAVASDMSGEPARLAVEVRSALLVIGVLSLVLASCAKIPTAEEANETVLALREYESWAWVVGIVLIWVDLVLPVPQTAVIAALGIIHGTLLGGLLGSVALVTGGLLGYGLMLTSARRFVHRFVGPRSLHRVESLFDRGGSWAIVLTRSLPYSIPEALVFLAGLAGMPMRKFIAALTIGSVPTAFAFAAIGAGWADQPIVALVVSYVLPILLLPIALYLMRPRRQ